MNDLISRQAVIDVISSVDNGENHIDELTTNVIGYVEQLPSAEKTAEWIKEECTKTTDLFRCSRCGRSIMLCKGSSPKNHPYCHCGAKMNNRYNVVKVNDYYIIEDRQDRYYSKELAQKICNKRNKYNAGNKK